MSAPLYVLGQRVGSIYDGTLRGKIISIFTHDTPTPPNVNPFPNKGEWQYLVLLDQPATYTQSWFLEDKVKAV